MAKKYPQPSPQTAAVQQQEANKPTSNSETTGAVNHTAGKAAPTAKADKEALLHFSDANWSFDLSSKGMAIKNAKLNAYTDRSAQNIAFATEDGRALFGTSLLNSSEPINFQIKEDSPGVFVGEASVEGVTVDEDR